MKDEEIIVMAIRKAVATMKPVDILMPGGIAVRCTPRSDASLKGHIPRMVIHNEVERLRDQSVTAVVTGQENPDV